MIKLTYLLILFFTAALSLCSVWIRLSIRRTGCDPLNDPLPPLDFEGSLLFHSAVRMWRALKAAVVVLIITYWSALVATARERATGKEELEIWLMTGLRVVPALMLFLMMWEILRIGWRVFRLEDPFSPDAPSAAPFAIWIGFFGVTGIGLIVAALSAYSVVPWYNI